MRRLSVVIVIGCVLAACGGGGGTQAVSIQSLKAAAQNTQDVRSAKFTMTIGLDARGSHYDVRASGVVANDGSAARIDVEIPGVGTMQELLVDEAMYMSLDGLPVPEGKLPEGKHWLRIDFGEIANALGLNLDELRQQAQNSTPTQGLEYLQGLSGDVEKVGDDTVNGAHATHYRASIDYSKIADQLPGATGAMRDRLAKLGTVPADVWIDDNDHVVKTHFTIDGSAFGGQGVADMTMVISDFDGPVDVSAPSPDEVIGISDLLSDTVHA